MGPGMRRPLLRQITHRCPNLRCHLGERCHFRPPHQRRHAIAQQQRRGRQVGGEHIHPQRQHIGHRQSVIHRPRTDPEPCRAQFRQHRRIQMRAAQPHPANAMRHRRLPHRIDPHLPLHLGRHQPDRPGQPALLSGCSSDGEIEARHHRPPPHPGGLQHAKRLGEQAGIRQVINIGLHLHAQGDGSRREQSRQLGKGQHRLIGAGQCQRLQRGETARRNPPAAICSPIQCRVVYDNDLAIRCRVDIELHLINLERCGMAKRCRAVLRPQQRAAAMGCDERHDQPQNDAASPVAQPRGLGQAS